MVITGDGLLIGLLLLGGTLMLFSMKRRNILLGLVTFLIWFSLGFWLFFSGVAPIGLGETWQSLLSWSFILLAFLPLLVQMDVEVKNEKNGRTWITWGETPKEKIDKYEAHRQDIRRRLGGVK